MYICDILLQQWHKCYGTNQPLHGMESTFDNGNKAKNLKLDRLCVHVWLRFGSFFFVFIFIMRERKLIWWVEKGDLGGLGGRERMMKIYSMKKL